MIPKAEQFLDMEPVSGSINDIIDSSKYVDVDYIYTDDQAIIEIMNEFNVDKDQAIELFKEAKQMMIQEALDELIKEGKIIKDGKNKNGEQLYFHAEIKQKKRTKKKKK